jgi:hypothetical protein
MSSQLALGAGFRYSGGVARLRRRWLSSIGVEVGLVALWGAVAAGCERGGKTPEEAFERLAEAVAARDGGQLFDALDLETRWSWMSVQRAQRESYDIVLSNFPLVPDRERTLHRFEAGAQSEGARDLFTRQVEGAVFADLAGALAAAGPAPRLAIVGDGTLAEAAAGARTLPFRKGSDGHWGWGYAGLADEAEQLKRRAMADLELMRTNAADYERAWARRGR